VYKFNGSIVWQLVQNVFNIAMKSEKTIAFIGRSANPAQMNYALYARLLNSLSEISANLVTSTYDIKILVKESVRTKRFHDINYISTFESRG